MKKSHFFLCMLFMCIVQSLSAQPGVDELQGNKTTIEQRTDDAGNSITVEEYRTNDKTLTGFKKTIRDLQGNVTTIDSMTTPGGKVKRVKVKKTNRQGDATYLEERNYDRKEKVVEYRIREYNQNRILIRVTNWKKGDDAPTVNTAPEYDPDRLGPLTGGVRWEGRYAPEFAFSGGYSYLNAGTSGDNISFPLGVHVNAKYNITDQLGIMADVSYHTKKDMDFRISRVFLMGGLQYDFPQKEESDITVSPHVLAGLVSDRQKYLPGDMDAYKESALAFGAGLDASYKLSARLSLNLKSDYIFTRFNDDTQGNIRVTGGIKYLFDF